MKSATLKIIDQVNCKFEGLEPEVRRKISDACKYFVPYARHMPAFKLGRWDGKIAFATIGGGTFINMLDRVLPIVLDAGYSLDSNLTIDDRRPSFSFSFPEITEDMLSDKVWPEGHQLAGDPIMLRDYQVEAIKRYLDNLQSVQSISTGAGKTLLTATLSQLIEPYGRSIVIVPNKSLVEQTEEDYTNLGLDVGVFYGDRKEWGHLHTICTWQSLGSFSKKTKAGETEIPIGDFLDGVACVMVDECFSKDTPILTPTGYRPISEIKIDDTVINYDPILKEFKEDTVVKVHNNLANSTNEKMYELEFDNGVVVSCTGNHKFLTTDGWVKAEDLQDSHELINTISLSKG